MTSRVIHFEIPIDDPARASAFYKKAFDWTFTQWGPMQYWTMADEDPNAPGALGALSSRADTPEGVVVYISVDNMDDAMVAVREAGGTLLTEKMPIPTMGWSAHFRDTEGNLVGMFQPDATVALPEGMPPAGG